MKRTQLLADPVRRRYIENMQYTFHSENIKLSETDETLLQKKLERLEKHVQTPYQTDVHILANKHHLKGDVITCSINIEQGQRVFHAERTSDTIQNALDETLDALQQEIGKQRDKELTRRRE